jgi:cell shape-determining protein MreC
MVRHHTQIHVAPFKVLTGMLVFSAVCMLIPRKWDRSDQMKVVAQPITMLQALMNRGAGWVSPAAEPLASVSGPVAADRQMLEGDLLAMAQEIRNLRQRNTELAALRGTGYLPRRLGQLIQADIISRDSLAYRSVVEINRGSKAGSVKGQWATTAFYLDRGSEDGLKTNRNVFTLENLIGQIVWVGPYTARVQLLTDPASHVAARIARLQPGSTAAIVSFAPGTYVLEGTGQGMVIQMVDYRLVEAGQIRPGDLVILEPGSNLPEEAASLRRAGRISEIKPGPTQAVRTLHVVPLLKPDSLKHVYVFDPTPVVE